jgi:hypothetical protein
MVVLGTLGTPSLTMAQHGSPMGTSGSFQRICVLPTADDVMNAGKSTGALANWWVSSSMIRVHLAITLDQGTSNLARKNRLKQNDMFIPCDMGLSNREHGTEDNLVQETAISVGLVSESVMAARYLPAGIGSNVELGSTSFALKPLRLVV